MSPGPAPTLVTDWFTWAFVLAVVAVFALVVLTVEILKARETLSQERLDAVLEDAQDDTEYPWPMRLRDTCDLESCGEPSVVEFAGGKGPLYICAGHAGPVSAWAPVVGVRMPYDQEASA